MCAHWTQQRIARVHAPSEPMLSWCVRCSGNACVDLQYVARSVFRFFFVLLESERLAWLRR